LARDTCMLLAKLFIIMTVTNIVTKKEVIHIFLLIGLQKKRFCSIKD